MFIPKGVKYELEIANELTSILHSTNSLENNCISLYEIANMYYSHPEPDFIYTYPYLKELSNKIMVKTNSLNSHTVVDIVDITPNGLLITYTQYTAPSITFSDVHIPKKRVENVYYQKHMDHFYIAKRRGFLYSIIAERAIECASDEISKAYDFCIERNEKRKQATEFTSVNAPVKVKISYDYLEISPLKFPKFKISRDKFGYYHYYESFTNSITEIPKNKLFDKIFVKIEDCPKYLQEELKKRRK